MQYPATAIQTFEESLAVPRDFTSRFTRSASAGTSHPAAAIVQPNDLFFFARSRGSITKKKEGGGWGGGGGEREREREVVLMATQCNHRGVEVGPEVKGKLCWTLSTVD